MELDDDILLKMFDDAVHALKAFRSQHISLVTIASYIINVKQHQGENVSEKDRGIGSTSFLMCALKCLGTIKANPPML